MDIYSKDLKPGQKAQIILDKYSEVLNKSTRNKLHSWPDWFSKDPWYGQHIIDSAIKSLKFKNAL